MNHRIDVRIYRTYQEMSRQAAALVIEILSHILKRQEQAVLVPSAGGTPTELYRLLAAQFEGSIDWSRVRLFQMDEYAGLPPGHPNSLANYLVHHLVNPLGIQQTCFLNNAAGKLAIPCQEYEETINAARVDLFVHGIGENGHLGFNEPGTPFNSTTRSVRLSDSTRRANSRFFDNPADVPEMGVTLGLSTIRAARTNIVLASGHKKRLAVNKMLLEEKTISLPASLLRDHPKTILFMDQEAAGPDLVTIFGSSEI